jgi:hypothetical protein
MCNFADESEAKGDMNGISYVRRRGRNSSKDLLEIYERKKGFRVEFCGFAPPPTVN